MPLFHLFIKGDIDVDKRFHPSSLVWTGIRTISPKVLLLPVGGLSLNMIIHLFKRNTLPAKSGGALSLKSPLKILKKNIDTAEKRDILVLVEIVQVTGQAKCSLI